MGKLYIKLLISLKDPINRAIEKNNKLQRIK